MGILKRRINTKLGKYNYIEIFFFLQFSVIFGWVNRKENKDDNYHKQQTNKNHGWTNGRSELDIRV